jgi:hypothetical protein
MSSWCGSPCPLWVKSGRHALKFRCPLYLSKRTFAHAIRMSALGHKRTHAVQQLTSYPALYPRDVIVICRCLPMGIRGVVIFLNSIRLIGLV